MGTLEKADAILVDVLLVTRTKETVGIENLWKKKVLLLLLNMAPMSELFRYRAH